MAELVITGRVDTTSWWGQPAKIWRETAEACEKTEGHLKNVGPMIKRYHGPAFVDGATDAVLDNDYHDWNSYIAPRCAFNNPIAEVTTPVGGLGEIIAKADELALNRWITQNNPSVQLAWILIDMQFAFGVAHVSQEPLPYARPSDGYGFKQKGMPYSPKLYRFDPNGYFDDAKAKDPDGLRFRGRRCSGLREELLEEAEKYPERGWNVEMIRSLPSPSGKKDDENDEEMTHRDEVGWREVWLPLAQLERGAPSGGWARWGFHGMILTLPNSTPTGRAPDAWLRKPRMYYGPPRGPLVTFGCYFVPGYTAPLAPLMVAEPAIADANKHAKSQSDSAGKYKKLIAIDRTDPRLAQAIENLPHHHILPVTGFSKDKVAELELGGITDQQIAYGGISRDRVNRTLHLDAAGRGNVEGTGTATEVDRARSASEARIEWVNREYRRSSNDSIDSVNWFIYHDNRFEIDLPPEAFEELGIPQREVPGPRGQVMKMPSQLTYQGGVGPEDLPYDALETRIELQSQRFMDEGYGLQVSEAIDWLVLTMPMMLQFPEADWRRIAKLKGQAMQVPQLEEFVDYEAIVERGEEIGAQDVPPGGAPAGEGAPAMPGTPPRARLLSGGKPLTQLGRGGPAAGTGGGQRAATSGTKKGSVAAHSPAHKAAQATPKFRKAGGSSGRGALKTQAKEKAGAK